MWSNDRFSIIRTTMCRMLWSGPMSATGVPPATLRVSGRWRLGVSFLVALALPGRIRGGRRRACRAHPCELGQRVEPERRAERDGEEREQPAGRGHGDRPPTGVAPVVRPAER